MYIHIICPLYHLLSQLLSYDYPMTRKIQDLPPEACAQLAPALVKLRSQSETLAQGAQGAPLGGWGCHPKPWENLEISMENWGKPGDFHGKLGKPGDFHGKLGKTWGFPWKTGENLEISMEN